MCKCSLQLISDPAWVLAVVHIPTIPLYCAVAAGIALAAIPKTLKISTLLSISIRDPVSCLCKISLPSLILRTGFIVLVEVRGWSWQWRASQSDTCEFGGSVPRALGDRAQASQLLCEAIPGLKRIQAYSPHLLRRGWCFLLSCEIGRGAVC